jgi:AcrR family transcriptional regulator
MTTPEAVSIDDPLLEERSRRIVETSIVLAEKGGFEAVRLRDVASHAGVALGTLYRRFRSKEELLVAALELETRRMGDRVAQRPPRGATPGERVLAFFAMATRGMLRRPNLSRAMLRASAAGEPAMAAKVGIFHELTLGMILSALRGEPVAVNDPGIDDRERLVGEILNQIWFAMMVEWSGGLQSQASIQERMRASVGLVLDGARLDS